MSVNVSFIRNWRKSAIERGALLCLCAQNAFAAGTALVGWSETGLHETDGTDVSVYALAPPYSTIHVQLISGGLLVTNASGIIVTYEAVADAAGSINTTSQGKGNFYQYAQALFGKTLAPDQGLVGFGMPGTNNQPQPMTFDPVQNCFTARGIPITPHDDQGHKNYYPLMRLIARDSTNNILATTDIVLPVSDEMDCRACHASGSQTEARPPSGWVWNLDPQKDYKLNILRSHDDHQLGSAAYTAVLKEVGYNQAGLVATILKDARASSRRRGFALGGTYGLGMALVYGGLGLVVVLGGAKFGTLNSSAWFNLIIAAVFLVMSLAMFDFENIDFSRFQGRGGSSATSRGPFLLALSMGAMAALLAGACVAPVVISVLFLAAHLYGKGAMAGLLLPFLLGLGMALPWPFAGAGLSFLPKPGQWMKWVKYFFGVLIVLFAGYYGHLAFNIFKSDIELRGPVMAATLRSAQPVGPNAALVTGLHQARAQGKPLLIDFAASWCKNCLAMDSTVFCTPEVKQSLNDFEVVRYDAEKPNEPPAKDVLSQFGVLGLPTYVVLLPEK
jgi:cytochrome c biogenesis protein CcdA